MDQRASEAGSAKVQAMASESYNWRDVKIAILNSNIKLEDILAHPYTVSGVHVQRLTAAHGSRAAPGASALLHCRHVLKCWFTDAGRWHGLQDQRRVSTIMARRVEALSDHATETAR
jgi:hypothetical protein